MENTEREQISLLFEKKYAAPGSENGYGITGSVYLSGDVATKVYSKSIPKDEIFKEAYMLAYLERIGVQSSRVLSVTQEEGFWIMQMTTVHGESMLKSLFGKLLGGDAEGAAADIAKMAEIQAGVNRSDGSSLPTFKNYAASVIAGNPALSESCRSALLSLLKTLPDGCGVCHGDIHPNNILCTAGGEWTIIDWPEMTGGDPCADACRSYVNLCRFADCSGFVAHAPSSSDLYANLSEDFFEKLRNLDLMRVFLDKYCALMSVEPEDVLQWLPIQAGMLYGYKEEDICSYLRPFLPA